MGSRQAGVAGTSGGRVVADLARRARGARAGARTVAASSRGVPASGARRAGAARRGGAALRAAALRALGWPCREPRKAVAVGASFTAVAGACVWAVWSAPFLRVSDYDLEAVPASERTAVGRLLADVKGQPLIEVDVEGWSSRIASAGLVRDVVVVRQWPATVAVAAAPLDPVIAVPKPGRRVELVTADGATFERAGAAPKGVPTLDVTGAVTAQARASAVAASAALSAARRAEVDSLTVDGSGSARLRFGDIGVLWGDGEDARLKAAVVDALLGTPGVATIDVSAPLTPATTTRDGRS